MAVSVQTTIVMKRTGDQNNQDTKVTSANAAASGAVSDLSFTAATFAAVTFPAGGSTITGCIIVPPAGYAGTITLKGVTGDTGVILHPTDPTYISLGASAAFGLLCSVTCTGLRIFWT